MTALLIDPQISLHKSVSRRRTKREYFRTAHTKSRSWIRASEETELVKKRRRTVSVLKSIASYAQSDKGKGE
jgi:hypothetical protein